MNDHASFLDYWTSVRKRTMRVASCIPPDRLEWAAADGRWSFGDILRHLAGIERGMYAETVAGRQSAYPGHGRELADGWDEVARYMARTHDEAVEIFRALTPEQWNGKSLTPAGTPITTWKWLRAMIEHEAHHRGQLYFMLGLCGVHTPPIYGLTEEEVLARSVHPTEKHGTA
ncbi:MAG: DinB family protein [Gemmatimonadaceae bacterium]